MNKILASLVLALSITTISCAPLEEKVVDPMKVVVAQVTNPGDPSQAEFTALRLKVERLEKLLERQINHTHSQYLEKGLFGSSEYAERNNTHSFPLGSGLDYAARNHTHDYASRNHSHGGGFP